jgi:hypothetical protein
MVFHDLQSILTSAVRGLIQDTHVLQLPEGGDFKALHFQTSRKFDRSTKLD